VTAVATTTPQWLVQAEPGLCACGCAGKRRRGNFVEKTISGGANVMRQTLYADDFAQAPGLLQRVDARVKCASLLGLLLATSLLHSLAVLVSLYLAVLVLAVLSKLPLWFFVRRVWLFIPIFTGIVVVPALLWEFGVTAQGLAAAALIVARVATSISLVVLLTLTTPWHRLLAGLRRLRAPRLFVAVLAMAYRYVFLLLGSVTDMYVARKARTVTREKHDRGSRAFVAASAGALFGKAHALSDEVHMAMVARGFNGEARTPSKLRVTLFDVVFAVAVAAGAALALGADRVFVG
jgi:cobalt/nickel transport system permease protein